jgi:hypothetical protein
MTNPVDIINALPNINSPVHLSKTSKHFINGIINQIKEGANSWKGCKSEIIDTIPTGIQYRYLVQQLPEVHNHIEKEMKTGKHYEFKIGERDFNVYLMFPSDTTDDDMMDKYICKIYIWLYVCCHFAESRCSPSFYIYIYMTDLKKLFPENKNDKISMIHANTGYTIPCPMNENEIYIFRREEWFKVFIHETFHSFGLDFALLMDQSVVKMLHSVIPIKSDFEITETYSELWGELINVIFVSLKSQKCTDVLNTTKLFETIEKHLRNEQHFSIFQVVKIMDFMDMKYSDFFVPNNNFQENTNIFAYYFLKSILLFYANDFIEWCHMKNGSINFDSTNINSFVELIIQKCRTDMYLTKINKMDSWFRKNNRFTRTLRLSITE